MTYEEYNAFCGSLPATTYVCQWGGSHVWKVGGKVFAIAGWSAGDELAVTFKVSDLGFDILKQQPGLLSKTWLSGWHSGTPGGLYAFDRVENARRFALDYFPSEAANLNAAFYTRVFDAAPTEEASRAMNSPFFV